jgi:hypothetical protein
MAGKRLVKRARANTAGDDFGPSPSYPEAIRSALDALPHNHVSRILFGVALADPGVAAIILQQHRNIIAEHRARVFNFDHYSRDVWHEINVRHEDLRDSDKYDFASDVQTSVADAIADIKKKVKSFSSFGTKRSALENLRKIGKTICVSVGVIPDGLREREYTLDVAMCKIVELMTPDERAVMCSINDGRGQFISKMEELDTLCAGLYIYDEMVNAVALLRGDETDEDEEDNHEEHDEEEDSEDEDHGC